MIIIHNRSINELFQIARDIVDQEIFTDRHVAKHDKSIIPSIFMPLYFAVSQIEEDIDNIGMLFAYWKNRIKMGINGYPIFYDVSYLSKTDTEKVLEYIKEIEKVNKKKKKTLDELQRFYQDRELKQQLKQERLR